MTEIPLSLPTGELIPGNNPVVILGPNGSGKTRLGVKIARGASVERIPASRSILISSEIARSGRERAEQELREEWSRALEHYWTSTNDVYNLLAKLKDDDVNSAIKFRDEHLNKTETEPEHKPEKTNFIKLQEFWNRVFPNRVITTREGYNLEVSSLYSGGEIYRTDSLSDGERNVFYLAARVLNAEEGKIILVDEPEIHLHATLARNIWDELESMRPDCRFVYITHDLNFALSRRKPVFILVNNPDSTRVLPDNNLPNELFKEILGAASFSVKASRIFFCEGDYNSDFTLYRKLLEDENSVVIPVGSCREVEKCVEVFNAGRIIQGVQAYGIIDRDYWPEEYFNSLSEGVGPLKVHEFESLFLVRAVFRSVCKQLGEDNEDEKYNQFLQAAKSYYQNGKSKEILERAKKRFEFHSVKLLNGLRHNPNLNILEQSFLDALKQENWSIDPGVIFQEEKDRIEQALRLDSSDEEFLRLLPGKQIIQKAAETLNVTKDRYMKVVLRLLDSEQSKLEVSEAIKSNIPT